MRRKVPRIWLAQSRRRGINVGRPAFVAAGMSGIRGAATTGISRSWGWVAGQFPGLGRKSGVFGNQAVVGDPSRFGVAAGAGGDGDA